jgi:hypothetical protein
MSTGFEHVQMFHSPLLSPSNSANGTISGEDSQKIVVIDCKGMPKFGSKSRPIVLNFKSFVSNFIENARF